MLTYKLKNISFNKIGIISLLGLFSLRIIENYRSGNYIEDFTQLILDSFKTILSPFLSKIDSPTLGIMEPDVN